MFVWGRERGVDDGRSRFGWIGFRGLFVNGSLMVGVGVGGD